MDPWNLTPNEWANVLLRGTTPEEVARNVLEGKLLPWTKTLLRYTEAGDSLLELGSGAGQNSALMAHNGRRITLLDISKENLEFSAEVFELLNLNGYFRLADMTKPLPFDDNSFDTVFSVGVFEYFNDEQINKILKEAFRIAKRRLIIMMPNASSAPYRIGYWISRATNRWVWGGERPLHTLKPHFESIENIQLIEYTVALQHSLSFLTAFVPRGNVVNNLVRKTLRRMDDSNPTLLRQGYLLISIGEKNG